MELFVIYLWLKLDIFIRVLVISSLTLTICISLLYVMNSPVDRRETKEYYTRNSKSYKRFLITMCSMFIVGTILPSSKDTAILVGASYAVDFAKSPEGAKIGTLIRKKANDYLDDQLKEVAKEQQPTASKP